MARTLLRRWSANPLVACTVDLVERCDSAHPRILRVLTYHRVDQAEPFARHVQHLAARYRVVSVPQVLAAMDGGAPLPPRSVLLTFDDAYTSFAEHAWPVLRRHGFGATLFVPTAYPDGTLARFWWDRLENAFRATPRREPLATPLGALPLASAEERARAHAAVKRHVKDLAHAEALRLTDQVCAALEVPEQPHEVLGWAELRALAGQGVTLGAHTRTHPRLDRVSRAEARAEIEGSLADLVREVPGALRVFAYPDGRFDDELVALLSELGVELAFTTRRGTNDVARADRLRLRRVNVDASDTLEVFRAKLAFSAARLERVTRLADPPGALERLVERENRREQRRSQLYLRSLDAVLTSALASGTPVVEGAEPEADERRSNYERVRRAAGLVGRAAPALERRVHRWLLDPTRLPLRAEALALVGFGSGVTVFRLQPQAGPPLALKVYRRTLGRAPRHLLAAARRYRERYERLRAQFGELVHPARFLVLHAPLCAAPAVACVQPWIAAAQPLLERDDAELLALLAAHGALAEGFRRFARGVLEWHARGAFPDLLGRGNLVALETPDGLAPRLIDYGIFDARENPPSRAARVALESLGERLGQLLERMEADVAVRT